MALPKRLEQLKKARSLNDIMAVIDDIAFELKNSKAVVKNLVGSLSSGEITFDSRKAAKPRAVEKFVAPNAKELQKHVDVIDRLWDNAHELDAAEATIKQAFAGHKKQKAALAAVAALKQDVVDSINDAFDALEAIADKHVPSKLRLLGDKLTEHLLDTVSADLYKDMTHQVFVTYDREDKSLLHFSIYLGLVDLKSASGFVYKDYYLVLTGVVDKEGVMATYLNSFPDFKTPGRFPIGKEVTSIEDAKKRASNLLAHNDIIVDLDKLPMPLDATKAKNLGFHNLKGVASATVLNDSLVVTFAPTATKANETEALKSILARLGAITNRRTSAITHKSSVVKGKKTLTFILTPNIDGKQTKHINLEKLDEIATILDLNDVQKKAMRFALQN